MTIKAFSEKYGVSYYDAYESSFGVEYGYSDNNRKDFSEKQMLRNLILIYKAKMNKANNTVRIYQDKIAEVQKIGCNL